MQSMALAARLSVALPDRSLALGCLLCCYIQLLSFSSWSFSTSPLSDWAWLVRYNAMHTILGSSGLAGLMLAVCMQGIMWGG